MTAVAAVTLDAAGTLIRIREPVGATYARLAREHGIRVDPQAVSQAFRTCFPRMPPLAFGRAAPDVLQRQERDWWRTLVRNCLGAHGQHPGFAGYFDALYAYYAAPSSWALYAEVPALLDSLDAAGIPVAVVSNFDSRLHAILDGLGVAHRLRGVLCSSEAGAAKPDPRIFHAACRTLDRPPATVLHAGDDRRADFEGARAAGLAAVWLRRETAARDRHRGAITDLAELPALAGCGAATVATDCRNS